MQERDKKFVFMGRGEEGSKEGVMRKIVRSSQAATEGTRPIMTMSQIFTSECHESTNNNNNSSSSCMAVQDTIREFLGRSR
jgi:hypothetical protein